eukprot:TRINITY_DN1378_c0_g1_i2.p1 TRINITY_DN1378_c0_g1~~TRINITY_DN1378_c0_g1_i2.p1  ORF type:complete len:702 (+),score=213.04 TRINITY_DN1378_c0_g1_i2:175-2106(+)
MFANSIYSLTNNTGISLDADELRSVIGQPASGKPRRSDAEITVVKKKLIKFLDSKKSQNIEIAIKKLKQTPRETASAIVLFDAASLGESCDSVTSTLLKYGPSKEETLQIENYKGPMDELGPAEQLWTALLPIPRLDSKLKLLQFRVGVEERAGVLEDKIRLIQKVSQKVQASTRLPLVLRVVLDIGNKLNEGTNKPKATGIAPGDLVVVGRTKGFMNYLQKVLAASRPDLLDFFMDFAEDDRYLLDQDILKVEKKGLEEAQKELDKGQKELKAELKALHDELGRYDKRRMKTERQKLYAEDMAARKRRGDSGDMKGGSLDDGAAKEGDVSAGKTKEEAKEEEPVREETALEKAAREREERAKAKLAAKAGGGSKQTEEEDTKLFAAMDNLVPISESYLAAEKFLDEVVQPRMDAIEEAMGPMTKSTNALVKYFGGDPVKEPFNDIFKILSDFVILFKRAHAENEKQKRLEAERAQKALEAEARQRHAAEKEQMLRDAAELQLQRGDSDYGNTTPTGASPFLTPVGSPRGTLRGGGAARTGNPSGAHMSASSSVSSMASGSLHERLQQRNSSLADSDSDLSDDDSFEDDDGPTAPRVSSRPGSVVGGGGQARGPAAPGQRATAQQDSKGVVLPSGAEHMSRDR